MTHTNLQKVLQITGLQTPPLQGTLPAELFEEALSRVSRQLGIVAHQSAEALKAERLAAAKTDNPAPHLAAESGGKVASKGKARVDKTRDSSGRKKYEASSIAQGAKRQAKRDNR